MVLHPQGERNSKWLSSDCVPSFLPDTRDRENLDSILLTGTLVSEERAVYDKVSFPQFGFWGVASEAHCSDWVSRRKGGDNPTATGYTLGFILWEEAWVSSCGPQLGPSPTQPPSSILPLDLFDRKSFLLTGAWHVTPHLFLTGPQPSTVCSTGRREPREDNPLTQGRTQS